MDVTALITGAVTGWTAPWMWAAVGVLVGAAAAAVVIGHHNRQ